VTLTYEQPFMDSTAAIAGAADNGGALRPAGGTVQSDPIQSKAGATLRTAASPLT
jgi:hypothetical protein